MIIGLQVRNAYSKGGIPLNVQGIANIKVPGEEPLLNNTLERFLGKSREEIMKTARETLEGNLRGVMATLTPEQVNQDKEAFAMKLTEEAEHDLTNIGLVLDTLFNPIQYYEDDSVRHTVTALRYIDDRASVLSMEGLISGDEYLFVREAYLQQREYLVNDGAYYDDFDDF